MTTEPFPPSGLPATVRDAPPAELIARALQRGEGRLASTGALAVETGIHTGRSVLDKFVVRDALTENSVWWDNNKALAPEHFDRLSNDVLAHARTRTLFVQDLYAGADPSCRLPIRILCEHAWQALFIRNLLRRPQAEDSGPFVPALTVVALPSFKADPTRHGVRSETMIACDFIKRLVLIGGTSYAGEIKKSIFTFLNFLMPERAVMPMHCSANVGADGGAAVFFGLSGTGKTALSADPKRILLGDDEHGWSQTGLANFEGGCYAKTIGLSAEVEPMIWQACNRFGTVLENVALRPGTAEPDFDDARLTENTRASYPLDFIANASPTGRAGHPTAIVMLTADAFGVLPPIAKLTPAQAMYHFLSGYTAKVAGTEKGLGKEPQATFSTCFGAPFMPRHPSVYGTLLGTLMTRHKAECWLVNTGWTGGKYGIGHRMPIGATRALLDAALSGALASQPMQISPVFGFAVPAALPGLDASILNPRETWADKSAYDTQARALAGMFNRNFIRFESHVDADVRAAAPKYLL
ncbi:MAG: phosphoenolpyruvate carboxykinase [Hyphomicrobiaceae bacterium]